MTLQRLSSTLFWIALVGFVGWDWSRAAPIDVRQEPPLLAAGSGQAASGGHCSLAR